MLPPIEDSVLQNNPKFANLHRILATNILNPSGSTKNHSAQKEHDAIKADLKAARIQAGKRHLIRTAISTLDLSPVPTKAKETPKPLPAELIELIILLSNYLTTTTPLPQAQHSLLLKSSQWASLPTHLPQISLLISNHLKTQALDIARILSPTTNASYLHRLIPKLPSQIYELKDSITRTEAELVARRIRLVSQTAIVLSNYHEATTLIIQLLEQTKHGSVSRYYKAKTEYLALHAREVELEVKEKKMKGEKIIYTDEVKEALGNYVQELRGGRDRLKERGREAERTLRGYGVGRDDGGEKEKVMKEIARVYGELQKEIAEVGRDVNRLKGS